MDLSLFLFCLLWDGHVSYVGRPQLYCTCIHMIMYLSFYTIESLRKFKTLCHQHMFWELGCFLLLYAHFCLLGRFSATPAACILINIRWESLLMSVQIQPSYREMYYGETSFFRIKMWQPFVAYFTICIPCMCAVWFLLCNQLNNKQVMTDRT